MDTIAVIDDRADMRGTVVTYIKVGLEDLGIDWDVIESGPLSDIEGYASWIKENDVRVLILDEKLNEEIAGEEAVAYCGHDVASILRKQMPDLPQMIITSVDRSDDLEGAAELDAIVRRDEFNNHANTYVERMVRLGKSYLDRHESELAELTRITENILNETATAEERERIDAIRAKAQLSVIQLDTQSMQEWLAKANDIQNSLQAAYDALKKRDS
jgi:hypothetical protein